jgi:cell division transport system permease protein
MKRKFITAGRIFITGCKNFFRNAWLSIAATAVMVVALSIMLTAVVLNVTARNAIKVLSKNLKVSVYLKDGSSDAQRSQLESAIKANMYTANIEYKSQDQAKREFVDSFQNDSQLIEGFALVGQDALPASFEVSVTDLAHMSDIESVVRKDQFANVVDSVTLGKTDAKKTIDRAAGIQDFITTASIVSASIFAAVSVLIIFNTIRMAIFTRGEEIRIMKLIGATPNFIRGPFLVEACLYGVIAGIIALSAVYAMIFSIGGKVASQAEFAETYDYFIQPQVITVLLTGSVIAGVMVGLISCLLAMERHLKLKRW